MTLRLIGLSAILAIAAVPFPATALAGTLASAEIASGDIEVIVASKGVSRLPAECATLKVTVRGSGATVAEARSKGQAMVDQLVGQLVEQGIQKANIVVEDGAAQIGFIGNEALGADMPAEFQAAVAQRPKTVTSTIMVTVMDLARLPKVRELLRDRESVFVEGPQYALKDDRPARRAAIADAVNRARGDADAYASALGMRVVRIAQVRDLAAEASLMQGYEEMVDRLVRRSNVNASLVETNVRVAVDFVLGAR